MIPDQMITYDFIPAVKHELPKQIIIPKLLP